MSNSFSSTALSIAIGILKNYYAGPVVSQFNDNVPIYRGMQKGAEKYNGLQVNKPLKLRRNQGVGSTTDGGTLPSSGYQTTVQAVINAKFNYLVFGLTAGMLKASQGDKGAFVSALTYEMEQGLLDLTSSVNRQMGWSGNGQLATVSANAVSSNVVTVTGRESTENGNKFLDVGTVIDFYTSAGVLIASGVSITAISGDSTATLTLSQAVTVSATDLVIQSGSYNNDIQGLLYTLDGGTSTIYSIDRSSYTQYQGNSITASGGQLTLNLMQQALNEARRRGGGKIDVVYCDFDSERYYTKLLVSDRRYVVSGGSSKVMGDGSFTDKDKMYLEFGGAPILADKDCPTRFFFLDGKSWKKYVLSEMEFADESGSNLIPQVSADAFQGRLRLFANIFSDKPSANAVLKSYISP